MLRLNIVPLLRFCICCLGAKPSNSAKGALPAPRRPTRNGCRNKNGNPSKRRLVC